MADGLIPLPPNVRPQLLPPKEAVDYLAARGVKFTESFNWKDVWQEEHAAQFTVSRLTRADLLSAIHEQLMRAVNDGISLKEFFDNLIPRLQQAGWWGTVEQLDPVSGEAVATTFDASRLKLIYDVNLSQSYAAGLWNRIARNKATLPFIYYRTMRDEMVRASHRVWDGVALPVDDPFWDTHYPPNGWRCRCTAYGIDEKGLQQLQDAGKPVKREAPSVQWIDFVNKRTGEVTRTPRGIDPGFAYNPGKAAARGTHLANVQAGKIASLDAPIGAVAASLMTDAERAARYQAWGEFIVAVKNEGRPAGSARVLGFLDAETLVWLAARNRLPQTAGVTLIDNMVVGAKADRHVLIDGNGLTDRDWMDLARNFDHAERVLWDKSHENILIIMPSLDDPRKIKLAIALDYRVKTKDGKKLANSARTIFKVDASDIDANIKSGVYEEVR